MKKIDKNLIFNGVSASRSKPKQKSKLCDVKTTQEKKPSKVKSKSLINEDKI